MPRPGRNVPEKSKDFFGSMKRLLSNLKPWRVIMILALVLAMVSAILSLIAPNKLSDFTDTISKGLIPKTEKLEEDIEADVCIIGGGITGISIAYELSKQGKKIVILERDSLADKTTGNTTAKITSQHGLFYDYLIADYGVNFAKKYYQANQEAIKNIEQIVNFENIQCDFERQDAFVFTEDAKELEKIKKEINAVKAIGGEAEFVNKIEAKVRKHSRCNKIP